MIKKIKLTAALLTGAVCGLLSCAAQASLQAPSNFMVDNDSNYITNAYFHGKSSPLPLAANEKLSVPWSTLVALCHNHFGPRAYDPCTFQVYATNDGNPRKYEVAIVTLFLSNGKVIDIHNAYNEAGLKIKAQGTAHIRVS